MSVDFTLPPITLFDSNGVEMSVSNGVAIPVGTQGLLLAGSDGTNARFVLVDANGRPLVKLTDGTNTAIVKAGSTPAVAADTALVVAISPNNTIAISAVSLPLPTGAATSANQTTLGSQTTKINDGTNTAAVKAASVAAVATDPAVVVAISPNNTVPVSSTQLPATLVGGRLDENVGSWLGSTTPTVGQKTTAASLPVTIASNQPVIDIRGGFFDTANSTSTPLIANDTYLGTMVATAGYDVLYVTVNSDVAAAALGLKILWSYDGAAPVWQDTDQTFSYAGTSFPTTYQFRIRAAFYRIKYTNGAAGQTAFTLSSTLKIAPADPTVLDGQAINSAEVPRPALIAASDGTNARSVKSATDGNLFTNRTVQVGLTGAASATLNTDGLGSVSIQITGVWTTGTLFFEGSVDGTNFFSVPATAINGADGAPPVTSTASGANGQWTLACAGLTSVRVRGSGALGGTATTTLRGTPSASTTQPVNPAVTLTSGTTGPVAVKAASTAAVAADKALVVALSPNFGTTGNLPVTLGDPGTEDVFGQLVVASRSAHVFAAFFQADPASLVAVTTSGGGSATQGTGTGVFATGTATTAQSKGVTFNNVAYAAHYELYAAFTASFTTPTSAATYQRIGLYDIVNGFAFGYNGTTFGVLLRFNSVDTFVAKASWNVDTLTGAAGSKFTSGGAAVALDPTKINLFRVRFGWLGIANVVFEVLSPDGNFVIVHIGRFTNAQTTVSLTNPNLPITVDVRKTAADATNLIVTCGCWVAGATAAGGLSILNGVGTIAANGAAVTFQVIDQTALGLAISGTWVGTLAFQYSLDGVTWTSDVVLNDTNNTFVTSTTTNQSFEANVSPYRLYRVFATAWTSGTATITYQGGTGTSTVTSQTLITDSSNNGPAAVKPASTAAVVSDPALVVTLSPNTNTAAVVSVQGAGLAAVGVSANASVFSASVQQLSHKNQPLVNQTITATGSGAIYTEYGAECLRVLINLAGAVSGTAPQITFAVDELDPGDQSTVIRSTSFDVLNAVGTYIFLIPRLKSDVVRLKWTVTGTTPQFLNVYATLENVNAVRLQPDVATLTNVAASASSVTLLSANTRRIGVSIHNDSTSVLFVKFGATASSSSFTVRMVSQAHYEVPFQYMGRIDGIWVSATGNARVTELT